MSASPNVKVVREVLLETLSSVNQAVATSSVIAILTNFLIEASPEGIKVSASDLEIGISEVSRILACSRPFSVAVPAAKFLELVRTITDDIFELDVEEGPVLTINGKSAKHRLKALPGSDFIAKVEQGGVLTSVLSSQFKKMVNLVTLAASGDAAAGGVLQGVLFDADGTTLTCVATDSFRYSIFAMKCAETQPWQAIVPAKALLKTAKTLPFEDVRIGLQNSKLTLESEHTLVSIGTMGGKYPDYRMLPQACETGIVATVPANSFANACRQVGILAGARRFMSMEFNPMFVTFTTETEEGKSRVDVAIGHVGPSRSLITYCNPDYLSEILGATDASSATLMVEKKNAPIVIRWEDGFVHGIMPFQS